MAFEEDYAERLLNPYVAAERGHRCGHRAGRDPAGDHRALRLLASREQLRLRKHDNSPLEREEHPMTTIQVPGACPHDCPDTCAWTVTVTDGVATASAR